MKGWRCPDGCVVVAGDVPALRKAIARHLLDEHPGPYERALRERLAARRG